MEKLFDNKKIRTYSGRAGSVKFLLGGIGTGNISIGSRGQLADFEIFNEPSKGRNMPYTFFSVYSEFADGTKDARVLERELNPPYERALGYFSNEMAGLPRFTSSSLKAAYPFVNVTLEDEKLPLRAEVTAFTPFIPLDAEESAIPGAYLTYTITNLSDVDCEAAVCGSFANPSGFDGYDLFRNMQQKYDVKNELYAENGLTGVFYTADRPDDGDKYYGNMAFVTRETNCTVKPEWVNGAWWDGAHDFWDDFSSDGELCPDNGETGVASKFDNRFRLRVGSLSVKKKIPAGQSASFAFILSWHFPNHANRWEGHLVPHDETKKQKTVKNHYAYRFSSALDAARYLDAERGRLYKTSRSFAEAMLSSTVDESVLDAVMSTLTALRSPTVFCIGEKPVYLAWEGCFDHKGSCEGNCTHVWNYAQTAAFLFPEIERSMRETEFLNETDETGNMSFRCNSVFGDPRWDMLPATDGQLGCVVRLYREWKFSGDDGFLKKLWPNAAKALNFAFDFWDRDKDCVLESQQHNTYDIEFYGPNSLTNSIFAAALKAGAEMAAYLGDTENESRWKEAFEKCSARTDELLWNGEYYVQVLGDVNEFKYQYGTGCLSDQVFGQTLAHINGLGYVLPEEHVKKAVRAVYENNFRKDMRSHANVQRCYALNDDGGLLLCSWPAGGRPKYPFVYADEVWSGIEYQVAAHLIYEGFAEEGISVVRAVRKRYSGFNRNPFNEVECGNHYARSLASYGVYLAYCGISYDGRKKELKVSPAKGGDDFQCFVTTSQGWGVFRRRKTKEGVKCELTSLYGDMSDIKIIENEEDEK